MTANRDPRFAELDRLIALEDAACFRRTMTEAAIAASRQNGLKGAIGLVLRMTDAQRTKHGKRAQKFRVYRVSCSCGECKKCRHRESKRKYNRRYRQAMLQKSPDIEHGTLRGYRCQFCRCEKCREVHRLARQAERARKAA